MIVGLDIASQTGVAIGRAGETPQCWTEDFGNATPARFGKAIRFTNRLLKAHDVRRIVFEQPFIKKTDNWSRVYILTGLPACIAGVAELHGIPMTPIHCATIDKSFLGRRSTTGREDRKRAIRTRCKQMGWKFNTQDEADAMAVWWFAAK